MLTGDLVRVKTLKQRVMPLYINRNDPRWLEAAESLLLLFREGTGMTRGEIESEIDELFGSGGKATLIHRGLAKVLEDRAEFEVVADVPPDQVREKVFTAAAETQKRVEKPAQVAGPSGAFRARSDPGIRRGRAQARTRGGGVALFADLRDENRLLQFEDISAERLIDRYNVALAQAVLLRPRFSCGSRSGTSGPPDSASSFAGSSSIVCSTGSRERCATVMSSTSTGR